MRTSDEWYYADYWLYISHSPVRKNHLYLISHLISSSILFFPLSVPLDCNSGKKFLSLYCVTPGTCPYVNVLC